MPKPKNEQTSKRVGTIASDLLRNRKTPPKSRTVSGSALTQRPNKKNP